MATELLLIEDVENLGRKGNIVKVRPGFARNFLLPRKLAEVATKQTLRKQERLVEERRLKAEEDKKESEGIAAKFVDLTVSTIVNVDPEGHMYGSVSSHDIVNMLKEQAGIDLEKRSVHLKHPLKQLGDHVVQIVLKEGVTATLKVSIQAKGQAPQA